MVDLWQRKFVQNIFFRYRLNLAGSFLNAVVRTCVRAFFCRSVAEGVIDKVSHVIINFQWNKRNMYEYVWIMMNFFWQNNVFIPPFILSYSEFLFQSMTISIKIYYVYYCVLNLESAKALWIHLLVVYVRIYRRKQHGIRCGFFFNCTKMHTTIFLNYISCLALFIYFLFIFVPSFCFTKPIFPI